MPNASPRPGLLVGLNRARARCSPRGTSFGRSMQPRQFRRGPTYLRGGGFLPSRKCLGAPSPQTPLKGYTFTLFRCHPCRHGHSSIRLQAIHMHHSEWLVSFPAPGRTTGTAASFPAFVPALCRESIPALQLDIPASGLNRRSHVFDATLPVATPHGRAGTLLAILPGVRSRTRLPCFLPPPAPWGPNTWPGQEVLFVDPASSCWGSFPCYLVASPGSSSGLGVRARPTPAISKSSIPP